jgi:hypothetical protein
MHKLTQSLSMLLACALIFLTATPALSAAEPVGKLADFSGDVILKSQGSWAVQPTLNHPLYSSDKVVTRLGKATIIFNDGAIVKIENNSNLLIDERVEVKGFFRKVKTIKRRLRLLLGKLSFKTGSSGQKRDTIFETPTAVCGIRGTAGTLSIGIIDGKEVPHIMFTEGEIDYTIGEFIFGSEAKPVPQAFADNSPAQRAVFVAKAAADQAARASERAASGEISDVQAALILALAAEATAKEVKLQATIMLENNPSPEVVAAAAEVIKAADEAIKQAQELQADAAAKGAEQPGEGPEAETYTPPGFDVDTGAPGADPPLTGGCASCN